MNWIESHQGLAAWVQAVFSVIAILWASKTAMKQVAKQHENDCKLRDKETRERQINLLSSIHERIDLFAKLVGSFTHKVESREDAERGFEAFEVSNYVNGFKDLFNDIERLPIYDLKSQNITKLLVKFRFNIRQIQFNSNVLFAYPTPYNDDTIEKIVEMMEKAIADFEGFKNEITDELTSLQSI